MATSETEDIQESELVTEQIEAPTKSDNLTQSDYNQKTDELPDTEEVIKVYDLDIYGTIEEVRQEFLEEESAEVSYYYEMEKFYLNDTFPNSAAINGTLQQIMINMRQCILIPQKYMETSCMKMQMYHISIFI